MTTAVVGLLWAALMSVGAAPAKARRSPPAVRDRADKYLETIKVSDNVYVFKPRIDWTHGNGIAIIGPDGVFFIDTYIQFNYAEEAIRRLRQVTKLPVRYVLNTHWHYDHVMGNGVFKRTFPECQIIAQDSTAAYLDTRVKPRIENELSQIKQSVTQLDSERTAGTMRNGTPIVGSMKPFWDLQLQEAREYEQAYHPEPYAGADIRFGDTLTMRWGSLTLRMIHVTESGHSPGNAIVWIPEMRLLAAGDLVVGPTPYATYHNIPGLISGIQALIALNPAIIIPGHGAVEYDLSYMRLLERAFAEYQRAAEAALADSVPLKDAANNIAIPAIDSLFVPRNDDLTRWAYRAFFVKNLVVNTYRNAKGSTP